MQNATVNVNGQILVSKNGNDAKVSVFDRSYLYGDSLYEVVRSYNGKFFLLNAHLERLKKSAELCRMSLNQDADFYANEIYRTYAAYLQGVGHSKSSDQEVYARLIVSRGAGKIGFGLSCVQTPTLYTIIVQKLEAPTPEQMQTGLKVRITDRIRNDPRALDPAMKSGNYLNNLLAYLEASAEGYADALMCNTEGHLTEGTTFNIFYVRRGIVATPPLDVGILDGITRRRVIGLIRELNLPFREVRFPKERLYDADEVFLTSSIREVLPITRVDQKRIGSGSCGPITRRLQKAFQDAVSHELSAL